MRRNHKPVNTNREFPLAAELSPARKKMFWLIVLAFPFLLLLLLELALRVFNYGGNTDLVATTTIQGKEYYTLNRQVGRRYFSQKGIAIPEPCDDYFEMKKSPATKRIFMLGESTMQGFPYDYNATAPRLYKDRLQQLLPQYHIEVINVGMSAINSYTVLDFIKELVRYEPDAFIVYAGHNEFYGAMGVGSTEYLGQWRPFVKLYLSFNSFRTFQLVRNGIAAFKNAFSPAATPRDATLMGAMVNKKTIPYHGREYDVAIDNFGKNLADIASVAEEHNIPIMFSTVVSNIRDQKPFISLFDPNTTPTQIEEWNRRFSEGTWHYDDRKYQEAVGSFRNCIRIDSMNADAYYRLGQCWDSLQQYIDAKAAYSRARDLDGLRFRATTDCNDRIRSLTNGKQVFVVDAEKGFEEASSHKLVGNSLMLEHLHPNVNGYFLLAKTFCQRTLDCNLLGPRSDWHFERNLTDSAFKELSGITDFDVEAGNYRTLLLTNSWPFKTTSDPAMVFHPINKVQEIAAAYVNRSLDWSRARYDLGDWYKSIGNFEAAKKEYYAVSKIVPYYYFPFMQMGDMDRLLNRLDAAETLYKHALEIQKSPFIFVRLGMLYNDQNRFLDAITNFELIFASPAINSETMNNKELSVARFLLAVAYGQSGNIPKAKENLHLAVQLDPGNGRAQQMLSRIP